MPLILNAEHGFSYSAQRTAHKLPSFRLFVFLHQPKTLLKKGTEILLLLIAVSTSLSHEIPKFNLICFEQIDLFQAFFRVQ